MACSTNVGTSRGILAKAKSKGKLLGSRPTPPSALEGLARRALAHWGRM